jgi:hypothetical protein
MTGASKLNATPVERVGWVVVGAVGIVVALVLFSVASDLTIALAVVLALVGAEVVVHGVSRHCPVNWALGRVQRSVTAGAR